MAYNTFSSTDYQDALDQLVEILTSRHLDSVAVNSGGSGHAVGDIIDITATGSTSTHVARLEVTSVSSGVIDGVRVYRSGAYTVLPSTLTGNAQSATTGSGTGATFDLTFSASGDWSLLTRQSEVDTLDSIANGGSGYSVSDTLTLVGGVLAPGGSAATFNVDSVSSGVVNGVSIVTRGDYEVFPSDPVLTTVSPSGGTGCTLNLTPRNTTGDTRLVLQGDAGSATDPLVGIVTYSDSNGDETGTHDTFNWAMFSMTSWSASAAMHNQANVSPGFNTALDGTLTAVTTGDGAFVPLKDNAGSPAFDMEFVVRHTGRSFVFSAQIQTATTVYEAQGGGGLLNQLGISSEFPYPAFVIGSSDRRSVWYGDTLSLFGGLSSIVERANGPLFVWSPDGSWLSGKAFTISGNQLLTRTVAGGSAPHVNVWPLVASGQNTSAPDRIWTPSVGFDADDFTLSSGATQIHRTPDTGGDLFPLFPVTIEQSGSGFFRPFGQIDGVFWFSIPNTETVGSRDRFNQNGTRYSIFQCGTLVQPYDFFALLEE